MFRTAIRFRRAAGIGLFPWFARRTFILGLILATQALAVRGLALPHRLVIAIDGIAYRDLKALQVGVEETDRSGRRIRRQAFHRGYFPVNRLISTFPSASDVAWTDIFGGRPVPGYQRTYYSHAANRKIFVNGVTSAMDYERQMTWRVRNRLRFAMSYLRPLAEFRHEVQHLIADFLSTTAAGDAYYALILSTDSAQHMGADIRLMLCALDEQLEALRAHYRAREGRELEILILSDHANNHAGPGRRVQVKQVLRRAGYRVGKTIVDRRDVILPTVGIESWVELHNAPAETERLVELLAGLPGADVVTGRLPHPETRVLVMNSRSEQATIDWNAAQDAFRYVPIHGDPLGYLPVLESLRQTGALDAAGFAPADAWMADTLAHRYPVALERIVRAHTRGTLNPASILISLANDHVHAGLLLMAASRLQPSGGTHGALDDLNSTGMLLSSFAPTRDTTTSRVAAAYDGFPGLRDPSANTSGAEWISHAGQALVRIARGPVNWAQCRLPEDGIFLRVWSPEFGRTNNHAPIEVSFMRIGPMRAPRERSWDEDRRMPERRVLLSQPLPLGAEGYERVYPLPPDLRLAPGRPYRATGRWPDHGSPVRLFRFTFFTDHHGRPVAF